MLGFADQNPQAREASGCWIGEAIKRRLSDGSVKLHMSEVEGPGKDWLKRAYLFDELSGRASLSQDQALVLLANDTGQEPDEAYRMLARGLIWASLSPIPAVI